MKKIILTIMLLIPFYGTSQDCTLPFPPPFSYGLSFEHDDPLNCGSGNAIYHFQFESIVAFSLTVIIEDITANSSTTHPITGTYDAVEDKYSADFFITVNNGHLLNMYYEYSEPGFYCKRMILQHAVSECSDTDEDEDGFAADVDCNDNNEDDKPFGPEYCDGYDNNCNGLIDDNDPSITGQPIWVLDEDNDGFPLEGSEIKTCFQPDENYFINTELDSTPDCDDTDPTINPLTDWYRDLDGDGYAAFTTKSCESPGEGYTTTILPLTDCDDTDPNINPAVTFECADNKDNNCNGEKDEIENLVFYLADNDKDGYGDYNDIIYCNPPEGYITIHANDNFEIDCNDNNPLVHPGRTEIPYNGIDDDCNPDTVDDSSTFSIPNEFFEQALIDLGIDTDGLLNNLVLVEDLENITHLDISFPETNTNLPNVNGKISDITGIELFTSLVELNIAGNNIVDLLGLTGSNQSGKSSSSKLNSAINLTTLKVLNCSFNNLTSLDVSQMSSLNTLNCSNNLLERLNVKNGINSSFVLFDASNNPYLNCISVDNASFSTSNWTNIDSQSHFSEDCSGTLTTKTTESLSKKINIYPNPASKLLSVETKNSIEIKTIALYNIFGQLMLKTSEKIINVNQYPSALYLLKIETNKGTITKRIIIE